MRAVWQRSSSLQAVRVVRVMGRSSCRSNAAASEALKPTCSTVASHRSCCRALATSFKRKSCSFTQTPRLRDRVGDGRHRPPARRRGVHHRRQHAARLQGHLRRPEELAARPGHAALQAAEHADHLGSVDVCGEGRAARCGRFRRASAIAPASRWPCICRTEGISSSGSTATSPFRRIRVEVTRMVADLQLFAVHAQDAALRDPDRRPPALPDAPSLTPRELGDVALDDGRRRPPGRSATSLASASARPRCTSTTPRTSWIA